MSSPRTLDRTCPACEQPVAGARPLPYGSPAWPMVACARCAFVYLPRVPVYERLNQELAWERTSQQERAARQTREPLRQRVSSRWKDLRRRVLKRDKLGRLVRRHVPAGTVLDIGCAGGRFLASLPAHHVPVGIEISAALAAQAAAVVAPRGGTVYEAPAVDGIRQVPEGSCTGVVMSSFLEHEARPAELLRGVARVLAPEGVAIIKVPNYGSWNRRVRGPRWCGFRLPDHVNYFDPRSLRTMLAGAGLRVVRCGFRDRMPTSDTLWMVAGPATPRL